MSTNQALSNGKFSFRLSAIQRTGYAMIVSVTNNVANKGSVTNGSGDQGTRNGSGGKMRSGSEGSEPDCDLRFDYSTVSSSVAQFLRGQAERIRRQAGASIIHLGKALIAAKHYLSHGAFLKWLDSEVGIPARTAQDYMQVAQWADGKSASVALLPPSILYVISTPSVPETFVEEVLQRIENGERVEPRHLRAELKAMRNNRRNERNDQDHDVDNQALSNERASISTMGADGLVFEAVTIIARGLSDADFARVKEIMTSDAVRGNPKLVDEIALAFRIIEGALEGGGTVDHRTKMDGNGGARKDDEGVGACAMGLESSSRSPRGRQQPSDGSAAVAA
jgi:hypothetical protein